MFNKIRRFGRKNLILITVLVIALGSVAAYYIVRNVIKIGRNVAKADSVCSSDNASPSTTITDGAVWGETSDIGAGKCHTPIALTGLRNIKSVAGLSGNYGASGVYLLDDGRVWTTKPFFFNIQNVEVPVGYDGTTGLFVQIPDISDIAQIGCNSTDCFFTNTSGQVSAYGSNNYGQLGQGDTGNYANFVSISTTGFENITKVITSGNSQIALKSDGTVWTWGNNFSGQLGQGNTTTLKTPTQISGLSDVVDVAINSNNGYAVKSDGTLMAWGYNGNGGLGTGTTSSSNQLTPVVATTVSDVHQISAKDIIVAVKNDGTVWTAGRGNRDYGSGPVGPNNTGGIASTFLQVKTDASTPLANIIKASTANGYSLALASNGDVYSWGNNSSSQLGLGYTCNIPLVDYGEGPYCGSGGQQEYYAKQTLMSGATDILASYSTSFAWKDAQAGSITAPSGYSLSWGNSKTGETGTSLLGEVALPTLQTQPGFDQIAGGGTFGVGHKADGTVWTWGFGDYSGRGISYTIESPQQVNDVSDIASIGAGYSHGLAVSSVASGGHVYAWGNNSYGQLGIGYSGGVEYNVQQINSFSGVKAVAGGGSTSIALKSDGTVYTWGENNYGGIAPGQNSSVSPIQVSGLSGITAIAAGNDHFLALKSNGTVYSWGNNDYGQLGDNTTTSNDTPQVVSGLSNIVSISAGTATSQAINADGTLYVWGTNDNGQLGLGDTNERDIPTSLTSLTDVFSVGAGRNHMVASKDDGSVYAWGDNSDGQFGNNTVDNSSDTPTEVNVVNVKRVFAAGNTSYSLGGSPTDNNNGGNGGGGNNGGSCTSNTTSSNSNNGNNASVTVNLGVCAGTLTITSSTPLNFSSLSCNTTDQNSNGTSGDITITDTSGSFAGWSATSRFTNMAGLTDTSKVIRLASDTNFDGNTAKYLTVVPSQFSPTNGSSSNITNYDTLQDITSLDNATSAIGLSSAFNLVSATSGNGAGLYTGNVSANMTIPSFCRYPDDGQILPQGYKGTLYVYVS